MTQFRDDDPELKHFLRQHRPAIPPPAADLEDQILAVVAQTKQPQRSRLLHLHRWASGALAAGLVAGLTGLISYRALMPPQPSSTDLAAIESYLEASWNNTVNDTADTNSPISELYSD